MAMYTEYDDIPNIDPARVKFGLNFVGFHSIFVSMFIFYQNFNPVLVEPAVQYITKELRHLCAIGTGGGGHFIYIKV